MKQSYFSVNYYLVLTLFLLFLFSSCGSKRDIVYFQNLEKASEEMYARENIEFDAVIMPNDNLFITVSTSSPNQKSVDIFNSTLLTRGTTLSNSILDVMGYLVNQKGNITFPLVGDIKLAGLTKKQAVEKLENAIRPYLEGASPIITLRFLNYKISILGEVSRPGVYTVTDERITIPQALALAGDLTIYGDRHHIQLIRMERGHKQTYLFDLTTPDIFFSPQYYLLQNDILYVAPNSTKAGSSTYNQNLPLLMSTISVAFTIIAFFIRK